MSNEWIYGEYKGFVDLVDIGEEGPWALFDCQKVDDEQNTPLVQLRIDRETFEMLNEDDNVTFTLTREEEGLDEVDVIYQDEVGEIDGVYIKNLKVLQNA